MSRLTGGGHPVIVHPGAFSNPAELEALKFKPLDIEERQCLIGLEEKNPGIMYPELVTANRCRLSVNDISRNYVDRGGIFSLAEAHPNDEVSLQAFLKARDFINAVRVGTKQPRQHNAKVYRLNVKECMHSMELEKQDPGIIWPEWVTRSSCQLRVRGDKWLFGDYKGVFKLMHSQKRFSLDVFYQALLKARCLISAVRQGQKESVEWRQAQKGTSKPEVQYQFMFELSKLPPHGQ